jgi:glyoxylase-like metal-dependent hydrolase (beta-lactamase superfamily II)
LKISSLQEENFFNTEVAENTESTEETAAAARPRAGHQIGKLMQHKRELLRSKKVGCKVTVSLAFKIQFPAKRSEFGGGNPMKYALGVVALLLALSCQQPAFAQGSSDNLIKQAVAAEGGADALRGLKTLSIKGDAKFWEPGQSVVPDGDPRFLGDATFVITWDLAKGSARTEWDRDQKYPDPIHLKYTETLTPSLGFVTDEKGSQPMSGIREAAQLRELERASPWLLVKAMDLPKSVDTAGSQQLGEQSLPAVSFADGGTTFIILFDRKTHLPAAIRTRDDDNIHGDSNYDLVLADWKSVGSAQMAESLSYRINDVEVAKLNYREVMANPEIAADTFAAPDSVRASAKPVATSNVPYQWVLRRLFLTRFTDSDNILFPNGGSLKLVELAPNVQHVEGGTANNLIIAMKDYLVIFDAPYGELQSRWVIDAAKAKYPGKPIKYLVLTHHHMDHTGGMRTYVAEGANVIVPSGDKAYFEKDVKSPHTIVPDELQKHPRTPEITEVKDQMTIKDDTTEIRLYYIPNPHVQGMLIGHVVTSNIVYVTDLISPRGPIARSPATVSVGDLLRKYNINGALIAGGHGTTVKQADITSQLAAD